MRVHVAQSAERILETDDLRPDAGVAQSAERVLGKDEVTGSIPVSSSAGARTTSGTAQGSMAHWRE